LTENRKDIRIVILGDALVSASGDSKGMGWVGRVIARTPADSPRVDVFALPVANETTAQLGDRWLAEAQLRFSPDTDNRLVLSLSNSDPAAGLSISRSRLNLANILDECRRLGIKTFVIGPTPHRMQSFNADIEHLTSGFEDVANRRGIQFVDCFRPLVEHEGWKTEVANNVRGLPGQLGHGLIAWLILNRGWYEWLEVSEED
jgi:acyl-CoA thioesterase-1